MNNVSLTGPTITSALPLVNPVGPQPKEIEQRVNDVAKPAFKNYDCFKRFFESLKHILYWIKNIPSRISEKFNACFMEYDEMEIGDDYGSDEEMDYDDDEDEEITYPLAGIQPKENVSADLLQNVKKNLDIPTLKLILRDLETSAEDATLNVSLLKFKAIQDLKLLDQLTYEIPERRFQISDLLQIIEDHASPEIKKIVPELKGLATRFEAAEQNLKVKIRNNWEKIEKLQDNAKTLKANGQDIAIMKRSQVIEALAEDARNREVADAKDIPPAFNNRNQNCWYHAVLEMVWKLGPHFHRLVQEKKNQKEKLAEELENNKRRYAEAKRKYDEEMIPYREKMKEVEAYSAALKKYRADMAAFEKEEKKLNDEFAKEIENHREALKVYEEELKNWEASDKTKEKPVPPEAPQKVDKEAPVKPKEIIPPREPLKPFKPADPNKFLDALQDFSESIQYGKRNDIRRRADLLQEALMNYHTEYREGQGIQHDPAAFVEVLLDFLCPEPLLKIVTVREGLPGTAYEGYKQAKTDALFMLQIEMKEEAQVNFQDLLDEPFKKKELNDPRNAIRMKKGEEEIDVPMYTEHQQLDENQNPPDILFVHLKRFRVLTREEQLAHFEFRRKDCITKHIQEMKKKTPDAFKDKQPEEIEAAAIEDLKKLKKLPVFAENFIAHKIDTPVIFDENHQIRFSNALYKLEGTVIHRGGIGGGHYVANLVGTNPRNGSEQWYHADDIGARVAPIPNRNALDGNKRGYVFFFKKVNQAG